MKKNYLRIILRHSMIRITLILVVVFLIILFIVLGFNGSFKEKIAENQNQIDIAEQKLSALENLITGSGSEYEELNIDKQLAPYDNIIPFISLLENVFEFIDSEAQITIKDDESEIFLNRYADYDVRIKVGEKKDLFFESLNEIYNGKFLTDINEMTVKYSLESDLKTDEIESAFFTVRLFFE